jgi:hypothetical protein
MRRDKNAESIAERLSRHWGQETIPPRPGAAPEAVKAFEVTHKITLPADMREYLLQLDGTGSHWPNDQDPKGFSFWPLARIRPVAEELAERRMTELPKLDQYFVFADYLGWSWAYAILLAADQSIGNRVALIGNEVPLEVASSFSEFVDLYLKDSPRLYGQAD